MEPAEFDEQLRRVGVYRDYTKHLENLKNLRRSIVTVMLVPPCNLGIESVTIADPKVSDAVRIYLDVEIQRIEESMGEV